VFEPNLDTSAPAPGRLASFYNNMTDNELQFTASYSPDYPELYTNPSAFIVFSGISMGGDRDISYEVISVTSNQVIFKLKKNNTNVNGIQLQVVVVSSSLARKFEILLPITG
jgi:hypothetical protein